MTKLDLIIMLAPFSDETEVRIRMPGDEFEVRSVHYCRYTATEPAYVSVVAGDSTLQNEVAK